MRVRRRLLIALTAGLVGQIGLWMLPLSSAAGATPPGSALDGVAIGGAALVGSVVRADDADGWTMTDTGPLGPADRDFLVRVRTAGLWEGPAGQMAQDRAASARVKEVGHHLWEDHSALDAQVRMVAAKLGVALPDRPTAEQQGWLDEMASRRGTEFDQVFADRLRAAHGKVFAVVAAVRAGTRNDTVREFAQTANTVVMKHMTLLESTGLVQFDELPTAAPVAAPVTVANSRTAGRINPSLVWLVLGIAALAGLATATRVIRPR